MRISAQNHSRWWRKHLEAPECLHNTHGWGCWGGAASCTPRLLLWNLSVQEWCEENSTSGAGGLPAAQGLSSHIKWGGNNLGFYFWSCVSVPCPACHLEITALSSRLMLCCIDICVIRTGVYRKQKMTFFFTQIDQLGSVLAACRMFPCAHADWCGSAPAVPGPHRLVLTLHLPINLQKML